MTALFIVRAEINDASDREPFDRWYEQEHMPQAAAAFQVVRAWRGWSEVNPAIHYAFYEFPDLSAAQVVLDSDALKGLVAEFDRVWETRVARTREVVPTRQTMSPLTMLLSRHTRRREVIAGLIAAAWSLSARAQHSAKVSRIGS